MPSMPSVPLMRASPSFSRSSTGSTPATRPSPRRGLSLAHQRQGDVRERREVAAAAQRAELPDHRLHAGVEQRRQGLPDHRPGAGAPGRQRPQPQQPSTPARPRARRVRRCRPRATGSTTAAGRPAARRGCRSSRARRSRWRRRRRGGRTSPGPGHVLARPGHGGDRLAGQDDRGRLAGDGHDVGDGQGRPGDDDGHACIQPQGPRLPRSPLPSSPFPRFRVPPAPRPPPALPPPTGESLLGFGPPPVIHRCCYVPAVTHRRAEAPHQ